MIIHISGASGSGKTTLGNKLKKYFGTKIVVKDIDDLRQEFVKKYEKTNISLTKFATYFATLYQQFIDEFIEKNKKKTIIFVGINTYINGERLYLKKGKITPKYLLDTHADYKFYISLSTNKIIQQRWNRDYDDFITNFCSYMKRDKNKIYDMIIKDETKAKKDIIEYITEIMSFQRIKKHTDRWNKFYLKKGYKFMTRENIYKKIVLLLKK